MVTESAAGGSSQRALTADELRAAARAGELIGAMTPGAPLGVTAAQGLPRVAKLAGREAALARTLASLADTATPGAIAISGPPGVGKTAFAAEVVARAGERGLFPGGVVWLACEGQSGDAGLELTLARVARALGAEREGEIGAGAERAALYDALHAENAPHLLLALDSVEPSLDVEALLDTLACGRAALLLTARQPIQDARARDEPLAPLDADAGAALLRQCLRQANPARPAAEDESLIAGAFVAAGGLPLLIGLTASLAATMRLPLDQCAPTPREEAAPDVSPDVRARLDRSWAALPDAERRLLSGLALVEGATFPRGVALAVAGVALREAAGAEAGAAANGEVWREGAAAALDALIGLRLVDALAMGRLRLHATVRRYAAARLREASSDARDTLGVAMASWWLDYACAHSGKDGHAALEVEAAGLTGAITWAHARERHLLLLDLTRAVDATWRASGRSADARQVLRWAVEAARALDDQPRLLHGLCDLASFDARLGRVAEARAGFTETLRLAGALGDMAAVALARHGLGALGGDAPDEV